jgi:hypothetical protein
MDAFDVKIKGIADLKRGLYAYSAKLGERVTKMGLRQGANYMAKSIRAAAPKKTGRLRRAIKVKNSNLNRIKKNGVVGVYITISKGKSRKDPKGAYYGKWVENGYAASGRTKAREVTMGATTKAERQDYKQHTGKRLRVYMHKKGARKVPGQRFILNTFNATKEQAATIVVQSSEMAAKRLAQEIGFNVKA